MLRFFIFSLACISFSTDASNTTVSNPIFVRPGHSTELSCTFQSKEDHLVWEMKTICYPRDKECGSYSFEDIAGKPKLSKLSEHFRTYQVYEGENVILKLQISNFISTLEGHYRCVENNTFEVYNFTSVMSTKLLHPVCGITTNLTAAWCSIPAKRALYEENDWNCFLTRERKRNFPTQPNVCKFHDQFSQFTSYSPLIVNKDNSYCSIDFPNIYNDSSAIMDYYFYMTFVSSLSGECYNLTEFILPTYHIVPPDVDSVKITPTYCNKSGEAQYGLNLKWRNVPTKVNFDFEYKILAKSLAYNETGDIENPRNIEDNYWSFRICDLHPSTPFDVEIRAKIPDGNLGKWSATVTSKTFGLKPRNGFSFENITIRAVEEDDDEYHTSAMLNWKMYRNIVTEDTPHYELFYYKNQQLVKEENITSYALNEIFYDKLKYDDKLKFEGKICNEDGGCSSLDTVTASMSESAFHKMESEVEINNFSQQNVVVSCITKESSVLNDGNKCKIYLVKIPRYQVLGSISILTDLTWEQILLEEITDCVSVTQASYLVKENVSVCYKYYALLFQTSIMERISFEFLSNISTYFIDDLSFQSLEEFSVSPKRNNASVYISWKYDFCDNLSYHGLNFVIFYKRKDAGQSDKYFIETYNCSIQSMTLSRNLQESTDYMFHAARCCDKNAQNCERLSPTIHATTSTIYEFKTSVLFLISTVLAVVFGLVFTIIVIRRRKKIGKCIHHLIVPFTPKPILLVDLNNMNDQQIGDSKEEMKEVVHLLTINRPSENPAPPQQRTFEEVDSYVSNYFPNFDGRDDFSPQQGHSGITHASTQPFSCDSNIMKKSTSENENEMEMPFIEREEQDVTNLNMPAPISISNVQEYSLNPFDGFCETRPNLVDFPFKNPRNDDIVFDSGYDQFTDLR